jgi:hypothetical protein
MVMYVYTKFMADGHESNHKVAVVIEGGTCKLRIKSKGCIDVSRLISEKEKKRKLLGMQA